MESKSGKEERVAMKKKVKDGVRCRVERYTQLNIVLDMRLSKTSRQAATENNFPETYIFK